MRAGTQDSGEEATAVAGSGAGPDVAGAGLDSAGAGLDDRGAKGAGVSGAGAARGAGAAGGAGGAACTRAGRGAGADGTGAGVFGPDALGPGAVDALDPDVVDADVAGAVGRVLEGVLADRVRGARAVDRLFADDLAERVAAFTLGGGKRLRSRFLWWGFRACGGGRDGGGAGPALRVAAALELLQTCALVQDDVMDDSALRRGRPAVHADLAARHGTGRALSFGAAAAVLAGDLALSWADDTLAAAAAPAGSRRAVTGIWRALRDEMAAGQYLDLHAQVTGARSVGRAARTAFLKSALYSVERPLLLGAVLAGAGPRRMRELRLAGRCAGLAFQFHDDLLGAFGDPRVTGKPAGEDVRDGRPTYLLTVARARAAAGGDPRAARLLESAVGRPVRGAAQVARVLAAVEAVGAAGAVAATVERLIGHGTARLAGAGLEPFAEHRLRALMRQLAGPVPVLPGPERDAATTDGGAG
ncbi:polyprenyl synthetase family protein [Streptantibioticus silvisoli]|uniref:Polyprenyl synthetase family protein n=1 Tax=Streptantibioticus silvisoli TaxID=2705255 RepID=A0ABT6W368_9ACTN|nr:polyprenyl synthetase family protein [Streptantibioticus silvisoli]MDI5964427.1 polyprenyl synthetase family protein [Streptantibioticus silvisoli]